MRVRVKETIFALARFSGVPRLARALSGSRVYLVGYHSIASAEKMHHEHLYPHLTVASEAFEGQLKYLAAHGHTFVRMEDVGDALARGVRRPTAIYFDDGFKNVRTVAAPILARHGAPATIFVTSGVPDGELTRMPRFTEAHVPPERAADIFLSWAELRELAAAGFSIGAHGKTHAKMTECLEETLHEELSEPRTRISQEVGVNVILLSYPHGRASGKVAQAASEAGYALAVTAREGVNSRADLRNAPLLLKKVAPKPGDSFSVFVLKLSLWPTLMRVRSLW